MASLKEYQMMFQLQAKLNSGFSSTMKSAQTELLTLQQKVQSLSRTQSDIAAYEKQQAAVEATRQKLSTLEQQYDNIQKEIQETEGFSSSLENQMLSKQQQIDKTSASLERQTGKLDSMGAALQDAGIDTGNLAAESNRLATEIEGVKSEEEAVAEKANNMGTSGAEAIDAIASALVSAGIVKMLKEIGEAYMACVNNAADFQETMSTVEALSGASEADMEALTAKAKDLGASTKFTATEAAEAMTFMGMAGWDAQDMLNGMSGVLSLAAASGEDLARTSDIVTDNLTAFGLTVADTGHFSDVLAAAATSSNTNVSIMGETFKNSAAIAGALGYSVEDVAIAVGLMANAGRKGSIAGTDLKNTFNGLLEGATLTSDAFGEYEFSALNADGTLKSFSQTIAELREKFSQMSAAEQVSNAMAIAGKRSYVGLLDILNATDEDYASLAASIYNCAGAAQSMAEIKMDNMNGQLTLMKSAWDAVTISVGEQFLPEMTSLYEVGTVAFTWVNDFIQEHPALVKAIAAATAVIGGVTAAIVTYNAVAKIAKSLDLASLFTGFGSGIGIVTAGLAGIAGLAAAAVESYNEQFGAYDDLLGSHQAAQDYYQGQVESIQNESDSVQGLIETLAALSEKEEKTYADKEMIAGIVDELNTKVPNLSLSYDAESDSLTGLTGSLDDYIESMYEAQVAHEKGLRLIELQAETKETEKALQEVGAELDEWKAKLAEIATQPWYMGGTREDFMVDELTQRYDDLLAQSDAEAAEQERLTAEVNEYRAAQEAAAEAVSEITDYSQELTAAQEDLRAKYEEVYMAALDSYSGQFSLMEEAAEVTTTSSGELLGNLDSQIGYWTNYNTNLQTVMESIANMAAQGIDTSNIQAYLDAINDGSPDAAGAIAGLASASQEDLASIGDSYGDLQTKQVETAETTATLQTEFAAALEVMKKDMDGFVAAMEQSSAATDAAGSTGDAYVTTLRTYIEQARTAGQEIALAAAAGMRAVSASPNVSVRGYAVGTTSAEPGFAWVGENGPELMFFNGGEHILNTQQSTALQKEYQAAMLAPVVSAQPEATGSRQPITIAPVYNIEGVSNTDEIREALFETTEDLREFILDAVDEANRDSRRRIFA